MKSGKNVAKAAQRSDRDRTCDDDDAFALDYEAISDLECERSPTKRNLVVHILAVFF